MQVSLTPVQVERLRRMSVARGMSMAHLIREALEEYSAMPASAREERIRRALAAAGSFSSGAADVSARHDDYLNEDRAGW